MLRDHFESLLFNCPANGEIPVGPTHGYNLTNFSTVYVITVELVLISPDGAKASGPDGIRPGELKMVARTIAPSITHLVKTSLTSGSIPEEFKTAHVLPLLKPEQTALLRRATEASPFYVLYLKS